MSLPPTSNIEIPILQELSDTGGSDDVRFLYRKLIAYFPQLSDEEIFEIKNGSSLIWRKAVQKAGKNLEEKNFIKRLRGHWRVTEKGKSKIIEENLSFTLTKSEHKEITHSHIQEMLVEIGNFLGFAAETEFEFYDVVWRENAKSPRLSHVFEVQSRGNIDSAFAKLKRAFQAQRSKIFLVISSERDLNRAKKSLSLEFQEIETNLLILTFPQIEEIYQNLRQIGEILREFLLK